MTRLGINVPNELVNRLKPFKTSINVSQVCRDALEAQVAAYERADARVEEDEMSDLIQKFRQEIASRELNWESLGHEDAKVWAELGSLDDFENLFYKLSFVGRPGMLERPSINIVPHVDGARGFYERLKENADWAEWKYEHDEEVNHVGKAQSEYELAWFSYIRAVWKKIQSAVGGDIKRAHERSQQALANLEAGEHVPGQTSSTEEGTQ